MQRDPSLSPPVTRGSPRRSATTPDRGVSGCVLVVFLASLWGCGGAIPYVAPLRVNAPGGASLQHDPDVSRIHVGITTRQEIRTILGRVSVWEGDRTFVGRWARSGMGDTLGGRYWGARNVLVAFDDAGKVERYQVCDDGGLLKNLRVFVRRETRFSPLSHLRVSWALQPEDIEKVEGVYLTDWADPRNVEVCVRGPESWGRGCFNTTVPMLATYAHYLNSAGPPARDAPSEPASPPRERCRSVHC